MTATCWTLDSGPVKSYSATVDMLSTGATTNVTLPVNSTTTVCSADLLELDS